MIDLVLGDFLPYRLSVLSNRVSNQLARVYRGRFGLSIPEWRVMAILGRTHHLSALDIVEASAMDKVAVSRAVARLVERALILVEPDDSDRRKRRLALTPAGLHIYDEVVPLAKRYEQALLDGLPESQRALLAPMLDALGTSADRLGGEDWTG